MDMKALRSFSDDKAQSVLSEVTGALLPNPSADPDWLVDARGKGDEVDVRQQVLTEARKLLRLKPDDRSRDANGALLGFLGTLLSSYALKGVDTHRIKQRLGALGDLPSEQYEIVLTQGYRMQTSQRGFSIAEMEETVKQPDEVQHLLPGKFNSAFSLYTKRFHSAGRFNDYILVVQAVRDGYKQLVNDSWRVYFSDIDLSRGKTPLETLQAFLDSFGVYITIGKAAPSKFFLYQTIPLVDDVKFLPQNGGQGELRNNRKPTVRVEGDRIFVNLQGQEFELVHVHTPKDHSLDGSFSWRLNELQVIEVAIGYGIDKTLYKAALNKHGVDTSKYLLGKNWSIGLEEFILQ